VVENLSASGVTALLVTHRVATEHLNSVPFGSGRPLDEEAIEELPVPYAQTEPAGIRG
jgi:hypothetical protein